MLYKHIFETAYGDIPESAVEVAKKSILDALGCLQVLGEDENLKIVLAGGGKEESNFRIWCKVPVIAAFANETWPML